MPYEVRWKLPDGTTHFERKHGAKAAIELAIQHHDAHVEVIDTVSKSVIRGQAIRDIHEIVSG